MVSSWDGFKGPVWTVQNKKLCGSELTLRTVVSVHIDHLRVRDRKIRSLNGWSKIEFTSVHRPCGRVDGPWTVVRVRGGLILISVHILTRIRILTVTIPSGLNTSLTRPKLPRGNKSGAESPEQAFIDYGKALPGYYSRWSCISVISFSC